MIKVLHVLSGVTVGGIETLVLNILNNIDREKFQFDFVVMPTNMSDLFKSRVEPFGCKVFTSSEVTISTRADNDYMNWWLTFLSENNYDIIHAHLTLTAFIYLGFAKNRGIKTISHAHTTQCDADVSLSNYEQACSDVSDIRLACSLAAGNYLYADKPFTVLNNAIHTEKFLFDEYARKEIRAEFGVEYEFLIGHVGRFCKQKNHDFLIDIFSEVYKKDDSVKLVLVGNYSDALDIHEKVERLGLSEHVIFAGARNDVNRLVMAMDLFLLPSLSEGFPVVLIEAQASGLPCIASDVVTKESAITDLVEFLPLKATAEFWANHIINNSTPPRTTGSHTQKSSKTQATTLQIQSSILSNSTTIYKKHKKRQLNKVS